MTFFSFDLMIMYIMNGILGNKMLAESNPFVVFLLKGLTIYWSIKLPGEEREREGKKASSIPTECQ